MKTMTQQLQEQKMRHIKQEQLKQIKIKLNEKLKSVADVDRFLTEDAYEILYQQPTESDEAFKEQQEMGNKVLFEGKVYKYKPGLRSSPFQE